jgi:predicted CoA-binding protein
MRVHIPSGTEIGERGDGDPITRILRESKTIAVVGLSSNPMRPSHGVSEYMQSAGYRIIPVNPNETEVLGEKSYARLEDVPERIDVVDIFRRGEFVPQVVESAIRVGAKVVWMQLGIENEEAAAAARAAGLAVVEDACMLIEHKRRKRNLA